MQCITSNGGVNVSRLCFGTDNRGRLDSKRATLPMLNTAHQAGLTRFDTAMPHGHGTMERVVGEFTRGERVKVSDAS